MKVKLTIYNGEKEYFSRAISTPCVIGRGKQSDVAIIHPLISRQHCEIYDENGQVYVRDLGSLNGTFFNGARIGRGVLLSFGSVFMIGRLTFKIEANDDSSEIVVLPGAASIDEEESRAELRRRALDALDDFEKIDSQELGLEQEQEASDDSQELGLTPEFEDQAPPRKNAAQTPDPEPARQEEEILDEDVIDLEKFLKGEL